MNLTTDSPGTQKDNRAGSSTAADVLSRVKISEVYHAATGIKPRRTGRDTWRALATWRGGDGRDSVSGDDSRGVWHDFPTGDGGGILDLVVRVRGGSRQDALRWCADLAGVPMDDTPLSAADRARWAAERRELERSLPTAHYWQRAAVALTEELLDSLKLALFDMTQPQPGTDEVFEVENRLASLRRKDGAALVEEYQRWLEQRPGLTAGLVRVAKRREQEQRRALEIYVHWTMEEGHAA
jgi:hypothetical protein